MFLSIIMSQLYRAQFIYTDCKLFRLCYDVAFGCDYAAYKFLAVLELASVVPHNTIRGYKQVFLVISTKCAWYYNIGWYGVYTTKRPSLSGFVCHRDLGRTQLKDRRHMVATFGSNCILLSWVALGFEFDVENFVIWLANKLDHMHFGWGVSDQWQYRLEIQCAAGGLVATSL